MSRKRLAETQVASTLTGDGDWYTIGLALGLGTALGVLFAGLLSATPLGRITAVLLGGAAGAMVGLVIDD